MNKSVNHSADNKRTALGARVSAATPDKLKALAEALGYLYGGGGSVGKLLDAIASGEVLLVQVKKDAESSDC